MKKYCGDCKRNITPVKRKFNFLAAALWLLLFGWGIIIYFIYRVFLPDDTCPICGNYHLKSIKIDFKYY